MNTNINEVIHNAILREKLIKRLEFIKDGLVLEEKNLSLLKNKLEKEKENQEKIEEISLKLMMSILSEDSKDNIEKENDHYFNIKSQYDLCKEVVFNHKQDLEVIEKRIESIGNINELLKDIVDESKRKIDNLRSENEKEIVYEKINYFEMLIEKLVQIEEAVLACDKAKDILKKAMIYLENAKNWGVCNSDKSTSFIKHSKITESKKELSKFNYSLKVLNYEINQINKDDTFSGITLPKVRYNFNILYDNIFSETSVQVHIKRSLHKLKDEKYKLDDLYTTLKKNKFIIEDKIKKVEMR